MQIAAISGSLRDASTNTRLLRALALLAPEGVSVELYDGPGALPHFSPDLDTVRPPEAVASFRRLLQQADAVAISTPEYAHGVPGVLKNALDWVVGSGEFVGKPVALISASPRAIYAYDSLAETLRTMSAVLVQEASLLLPLLGSKAKPSEIAADPALSSMLRQVIGALMEHAARGAANA